MDEEIETLMVAVRADTRGFARDVDEMRSLLDGPLVAGLDRAGNALERTLSRAIRTGSLSFEDLRRTALRTMNDIAASAVDLGLGQIFGGSGSSGGLLGLGTSILSAALGLPGRATGGPVTGGSAYLVGERGPEIFVPTSSGRIEAPGSAPSATPNVQVTINLSDHGRGSAPQQLQRSGRQVARAVQAAMARAGR